MRGSVRLAGVMLCVALVAMGPAAGAATLGGEERWISHDPSSSPAIGPSLVLAPDGHTVYTGAVRDERLEVVARDAATGAQRWDATVAPASGGEAFTEAVAVSPDGSHVFVVGDVELSFDTRPALLAMLDATTGSVVWTRTFPVGLHHEFIPNDLVVSPDGGTVFVSGARTGTRGLDDFWDFFTVAFATATGAPAWASTYRGPGAAADVPVGLEASPDGGTVFVAGTSGGAGTGRDFAAVAYDASDGAERWTARSGTPDDEQATAVALAPGGARLYVTGGSSGTGAFDMRTVAFETTAGHQVWSRRFDSGQFDEGLDVAVSPDGARVVVAGFASVAAETVAYAAATGRELWSAASTGGHGFDGVDSVAVSPDGSRAYVTGWTAREGFVCIDLQSTDLLSIAYDLSTGAQAWSATYGVARPVTTGAFVAVAPDGGSVYVDGTDGHGCGQSNLVTIAYGA